MKKASVPGAVLKPLAINPTHREQTSIAHKLRFAKSDFPIIAHAKRKLKIKDAHHHPISPVFLRTFS